METGKVKWFDEVRGFGFIIRDNGGHEVFIHFSNIEGEGYRYLHEGQRVSFQVIEEEKGPQAKNCQAVNSY